MVIVGKNNVKNVLFYTKREKIRRGLLSIQK